MIALDDKALTVLGALVILGPSNAPQIAELLECKVDVVYPALQALIERDRVAVVGGTTTRTKYGVVLR